MSALKDVSNPHSGKNIIPAEFLEAVKGKI
jgi:hypothetical protein